MARNSKKRKSNNNFRSKGSNECRRDYYKSKSDIKDLKSDEDTSRSGNDPAWYASNPILLRDAASYPFSFVTGATNIHDPAVWADVNVKSGPFNQVPGIASLHVHPTVGTSLKATDPVNVASQSVYSFVRHANSGHSNYDPADLMLYILAMANMYSFLVWCQRLYGYALTYDQRNRYIPRDLVRTNNVDPDDLINNLANFRFWINTLIAKMASFAVPATMSVFSRMSFMYSDYYIEGTSIKEQLYQFVPDGFYQFGIDSDVMGNLEWKAIDWSKLMKVADVINYGNELFNAIWSQEDFGIMSGDVLKAYGDNIIKLTQIPESYAMVPKFDPMVLTQIKNANIVRANISRISQSSTTGDILQTVAPLPFVETETYYGSTVTIGSSTPKLNAGMLCTYKDYNILTVDTDQPTPDVVIEATRLKISFDGYKNWIKCGTEVVTKVIITAEPGKDLEVSPIMATYSNYVPDADTLHALNTTLEVARNFHYMPLIWHLDSDQTDGAKLSVNCIFDVDNFTVLTGEDVAKLHEAALVNMFAVPSVGKV